MADGYIIELTNPPAAEGKPAKEIWYAHIPDRKRAIRAVRKAAGSERQWRSISSGPSATGSCSNASLSWRVKSGQSSGY